MSGLPVVVATREPFTCRGRLYVFVYDLSIHTSVFPYMTVPTPSENIETTQPACVCSFIQFAGSSRPRRSRLLPIIPALFSSAQMRSRYTQYFSGNCAAQVRRSFRLADSTQRNRVSRLCGVKLEIRHRCREDRDSSRPIEKKIGAS